MDLSKMQKCPMCKTYSAVAHLIDGDICRALQQDREVKERDDDA